MTCPTCGATAAADAAICGGCGGELPHPGGPSDPLLGQILDGRLHILARLGEGGFGAVYRAEQISVGREVAVKVLHSAHERDDHVIGRFKREARAACQLRDPHTVVTHDFGRAKDGTLYLVMEYLRGKPLHEIVRDGPLPVERALAIADQVCQSLAEAHAAGIVHRDIKPENVMVEARPGQPDFAKVLDFGIAKIVEGDAGERNQPRITRQGQTVGSVEGMPPEQLRGEALDGRTDLYAVGVLLYRMLCGRPPFSGSAASIITAQLGQEPPAPRTLRPDIPAAVELVVLRCLAKNREHRPPSAQALRTEMREALAGQALAPTVATHTVRRWRETAVGLVAQGVGVAVLAVVGVLIVRGTPDQPSVTRSPPPRPPIVASEHDVALKPVGHAHELFSYIPADIASAVAIDLQALRLSALGPDLAWLIDRRAPVPLESIDRLALADGENPLGLSGLRLSADAGTGRRLFVFRTVLSRRAVELAFGVRPGVERMHCHDAEYVHAGPGHIGFLSDGLVFGAGSQPVCPAIGDRPLATAAAAASLLAHAGYTGRPGPTVVGYSQTPQREVAFVLDHPDGRARLRAAARPSDCGDVAAIREVLALTWQAPPTIRAASASERICLLSFQAGRGRP